jgi:hypothetical protein
MSTNVYLSAAQTAYLQQVRTDAEPVAQSFIVDTPGGAFVTSLDLYFSAKDATLPVTVDIRPMENGIPTGIVIPYSTVSVSSANVNVSNNGTVATKFTFPSPVYLLDTAEYCFTVTANTDGYKLWTAEIGKFDTSNPEFSITKQPYAGVMFKSQNTSTWVPDLNRDIKFLMRRAEFVSSGNLILNEAPIPAVVLGDNPLQTYSGTKKIRVFHKNHGHFAGASEVTISGLTAATAYNGIPGSELNGTHNVVDAEQNSYTFYVPTTNATSSGRTGGAAVAATENRVFDIFYQNAQQLTFKDTSSDWFIRTAAGKSLAGSEVPHSLSEYYQIPVNQNVPMKAPQVVRAVNSASPTAKSLYVKNSLSTTRSSLSPILDLNRASAIAINYRLDRPASSAANGFNVVENYIPETAANGASTLSKYITRRVDLASAAAELRIYLSTNRPNGSYIQVYYKVTDNIDADFDSIGWTEIATPIGGSGVPINDDPTTYNDVEYEVTDQSLSYRKFVAFAVKIVFTSTNSSAAPSCADLRVIAVT